MPTQCPGGMELTILAAEGPASPHLEAEIAELNHFAKEHCPSCEAVLLKYWQDHGLQPLEAWVVFPPRGTYAVAARKFFEQPT